MERRDFLKKSCTICLALGSGVSLVSLSSCGSALSIYTTAVSNNRLSIPVEQFALTNFQIVRPLNYGYDIAVNKQSDGTYQAIKMECTHANNPLTATGSGFYCSEHGSAFDKQGKVTNGPAVNPLKHYKTEVENYQLFIYLS